MVPDLSDMEKPRMKRVGQREGGREEKWGIERFLLASGSYSVPVSFMALLEMQQKL